MSAKRAAIRREQKAREKANRKVSDTDRRAIQGRDDGRELAFFATINVLHEQFHFGKKRISELMRMCREESARYDNEGVQFILQYYADKIDKKIAEIPLSDVDSKDMIYVFNRNTAFVTTLSIMCVVLNESFGMASNMKNTGRLDEVMERVCMEYIKVLIGRETIGKQKQKAVEVIEIE